MLRATKRMLRNYERQIRVHSLTKVAGGLALELNQREQNPEYARIDSVVEALIEIERIIAKDAFPSDAYARIYGGQLGQRAKQLKEFVDDFLRDANLTVSLGEPRLGGWSLRYALSAPNESAARAHFRLITILVFDAALRGALRFLFKCETCRYWFLRRRKDHRFCSSECRDENFRHSNRGRAKRTEYMRRYRAGLRRRDAASIGVARANRPASSRYRASSRASSPPK